MTKENMEQKTFEYFNSGFHCAEAILKTFVDLYSKEPDPSITKFASGFGGGMGGSHCETCGALTGGIIALGWLYGRKDPCDDKQKVFSLSSEFRAQFLKNFSSTNCQIILGLMEKQEIKMDCKKLTAGTAGILYEILEKEDVQKSEE
jgi:C_GCAxxG_C_C family probable redox protein